MLFDLMEFVSYNLELSQTFITQPFVY